MSIIHDEGKSYQIIDKIYESTNSLVYRATLNSGNQPIILKILKENYPTPAELNRYRQEYEITHSLSVESVIKAYKLQRYENSLVMFLEDFGGESLKVLLTQNTFDLEDFLAIAIKITEGLAEIHAANIIHKDINPSNLVYNSQTKQLKIIDFGISTRLSQEFPMLCSPNQLEGTLAYIAPEQTGRMNRGIDYRSDFYSLGVTFYELLTNTLPFETNDPIELVHCHIAQQSVPVHERVPDIPVEVSNIIRKLLAKIPEDRYQSAWGIKADLETCLNQLRVRGWIEPFSLGRKDFTEKFRISQKLYGREQEVAQMLETFEQVCQGITRMILISGYSGVGKSALVNEIHKPITQKRGEFISGKFDQLQRDIPYSAISQAFQGLIRKLLTESEITLIQWKNRILKVVGDKGQILIDIIPDLEKIIGPQAPVEPLGRIESQNRFNLFFQRFLKLFCQKENPLVIFIDDLQWADLPSLNLIEKLVSNPDSHYFLLIGAYRDNEVSSTHPLLHTLEKIDKAQVPIDKVNLSPLGINHISQLIADTLSCTVEDSTSLAELVVQKTGGNPFFITQLLNSLHQEKLLFFNQGEYFKSLGKASQGFWQWDMEKIRKVSITDNVVDLMVSKIEKLGQETQQILKVAACIGSYFDLEILTIVNNKSPLITVQELKPALYEGLIIPLDNNYKIPLLLASEELSGSPLESSQAVLHIPYKFLHDRVQQASYSLLTSDEKKQIHLRIGRLLLEKTQAIKLESEIFYITNQFNEASTLITDQSEKNELARLNCQASKKAKASAAYESALIYAENALNLLALNSWVNQYELTLEIFTEAIEIRYLNSQFEQAEILSSVVLENAKEVLDVVKIYELKVQSYYAQLQLQEAIDTALEILAKLEVIIPSEISQQQAQIAQKQKEIELFLQNKSISELANLPEMTNPYKLAAIRILLIVTSSAIITNPQLYPVVTLVSVSLCLKYGNSRLAASVYVFYGQLLCGFMQNINSGHQFGKLALSLLERYSFEGPKALVTHYNNGFIRQWKEHFRNINLDQIEEAFQSGLEVGDFENACYNAIDYCLFSTFRGSNLEKNQSKYAAYGELIANLKQEYSFYYFEACRKISLNLSREGSSDYQLLFRTSQEEEDELLQYWIQHDTHWLLFISSLSKTCLAYFLKDYDRGLKSAYLAEQYSESSAAYLVAPQHYFYSSLTLLAVYQKSDPTQRRELEKTVAENQKKLDLSRQGSYENYQHKYDLVEAERARILGQSFKAEELYSKAIKGAKQYEFIHEEALAYERAAEFYFDLGRDEIGQFHLKNAYHCYTRWGATTKIKELEKDYPHLLLSSSSKSSQLSTTISTTGNAGESLDLNTVLKASQAISSEIKLEILLDNLMKVVIENAGAQKGFLILDSNESWVIEAQGVLGKDDSRILQSIPIDSIDTKTSIPILPTKIINYVRHTQESIVLDEAIREGQFIDDPYIIAHKSKSILCTPLLNQGQLKGIVYLENNLTTGAFTADRVELLNILAAQAAISIDNSRLYETLEQRVEERTQELSQTLDVLKATQAELIFENDLLRNEDQPSTFDYQVGGSLPMDSPTYVVRSADRTLYKTIKQGEFCYILNARQMGKSSLMVRMINHLQSEGVSCAAIDMTRIGSENVTPEQWYKGLAVELWRSFGLLRAVNLKTWWKERMDISPIQRLGQFIEEVVLVEVGKDAEENPSSQKLVLFIDEIDSVLGLDFPVSDFFRLIRSCYNQRTLMPEYQRLTFALFGVATPSELIGDRRLTPFNIGQSIPLQGFKEHEAQPLLNGLKDKVTNPQVLLKEVLGWTGGQPFLTQKICQLIHQSSMDIPINQEAQWVKDLVHNHVIDEWESKDEPEHLKTIRDRILNTEQSGAVRSLYHHILTQDTVASTDSAAEKELILSGLVIKREGLLIVHNRIYRVIFNVDWIESLL